MKYAWVVPALFLPVVGCAAHGSAGSSDADLLQAVVTRSQQGDCSLAASYLGKAFKQSTPPANSIPEMVDYYNRGADNLDTLTVFINNCGDTIWKGAARSGKINDTAAYLHNVRQKTEEITSSSEYVYLLALSGSCDKAMKAFSSFGKTFDPGVVERLFPLTRPQGEAFKDMLKSYSNAMRMFGAVVSICGEQTFSPGTTSQHPTIKGSTTPRAHFMEKVY